MPHSYPPTNDRETACLLWRMLNHIAWTPDVEAAFDAGYRVGNANEIARLSEQVDSLLRACKQCQVVLGPSDDNTIMNSIRRGLAAAISKAEGR